MLNVTIELLPGGDTDRRLTIASMRIANISYLADLSDYRVDALEAANPLTGTSSRNGDCIVLAHERRQSVWKLLERACAEIIEADWVEL
ncbi:hypothetical protein [Bradyrhizobium lablabi]|uniref:hypothetical protein n=1 Tax=Bradyrhizobium lablabi TaxID=722472 RepID=UPI001BAE2FFC|nr:hypothetical protein [Bradyrhizobium lablabi]MBR0695335.1 hypothetical protein [Bradyrhizobium lablabi]